MNFKALLLFAMFIRNVFSLKCGIEKDGPYGMQHDTDPCVAGDEYCVTVKVGKALGKGCFQTVVSMARTLFPKPGDVQEFINKNNICGQEGCADHVINKKNVEICCCKGDMCNDSPIAPISVKRTSLPSQKKYKKKDEKKDEQKNEKEDEKKAEQQDDKGDEKKDEEKAKTSSGATWTGLLMKVAMFAVAGLLLNY